MPRVTVIIPTYRRSELLRVAIRSVLNQTYQDFEIVVVDDNSGDDTEQTVRSFSDPRIRYLAHKANLRCGAARNTAMCNTRSELVAFLDDDDEWLPEKLERQIALLDRSSPATGAIFSGFFNVDRVTGRSLSVYIPRPAGRILDRLGRNALGPPSVVLLRRSCLERVGLFDESLAFGEDWDLWIRLARRFEFGFVEEPLVRYSVHGDRMTTNHAGLIRGLEQFTRKHRVFFEEHPEDLSDCYLSIGRHYTQLGEIGKARAAFWKAVRLTPRRLKPHQHLVLSLFGERVFLAVALSPEGGVLSKIRSVWQPAAQR